MSPVAKRDPPGFLQSKKDLAVSMQTLKLELSPVRQVDNRNQLQKSLEIPPLRNMVNELATKREERKPPASIAGKNNETMDLSAILQRLDKSPATPAMKKTVANKYLAGKAEKENCIIF